MNQTNTTAEVKEREKQYLMAEINRNFIMLHQKREEGKKVPLPLYLVTEYLIDMAHTLEIYHFRTTTRDLLRDLAEYERYIER